MKQLRGVVLLAALAAALLASGCATMDAYEDESAWSSDQDLADEVASRLREDTLTREQTFGVTADNGIVTLQGAVPSESARARAVAIARGTPGVHQVIDKLYRW